MRYYYYLDDNDIPVRVLAWNKRPSDSNVPKRHGAWRIEEFDGSKWYLPVIPQVTWGVLKTLRFVGWCEVKLGRDAPIPNQDQSL